jgi:SAM-dependent methyltransferase
MIAGTPSPESQLERDCEVHSKAHPGRRYVLTAPAVLPRWTLSTGAIARWHLIRSELAFILRPADRGGRLLDVGCGRGEYVVWAARSYPALDVCVGIDEMERDASGPFLRRPDSLAGRVHLIAGLFEKELVQAHGPFRVLLCVDVLEHVPKDFAFVREMAAVAADRASLIVHVPAVNQRHALRAVGVEFERRRAAETDQHVREGYSADGIRALLEDGGWSVEMLRPTFGPIAIAWSDADYVLAESGRVGFLVRASLLPLTVAGAVLSKRIVPERGNGWLVRARRR